MSNVKRLVLTALFVATGLVLPMAFHSIPNAGTVFLPMHIPVLLCGLICGMPHGLLCGMATPLLSCLLLGMPPIPILPSMLCELTVYGLVSAQLMRAIPSKGNVAAQVTLSLMGAMLSGRVVSGILNALIFRAGNYSLQIWLTSAFLTALPGVLIQLVLIPSIILVLQRARLIALIGLTHSR